MGRHKSPHPEALLTRSIRTRVSDATFQRLERIRATSNCRSIGELTRKILARNRILILNRDAALDNTMEELASIRKELNAIGTNINQITHAFHLGQSSEQRFFRASTAAREFQQVGEKVDRLLMLVEKLAKSWLQE